MPSVNLARERSLYKAFTDHAVQARQRELASLQEQLATGRRINRPSDDAAAFGQARQLDVLGDRYTQYQRSIDSARSWTNHTQEALDNLSELLTQAYEEGVRYASDSHGDDHRNAAADRLDALLVNIVDGLNTRAGDEYVFAGSRTTVEPFTLAAGAVTYNGNDGGRTRHVSRNMTLDVNITGQDLHDTGNGYTITEAVTNLSAALRAGNSAQIATALDEVEASRDHVVDKGGEAGNIANRLELAHDHLSDSSLLLAEQRSTLADASYADVVQNLQKAQTGLQASLRVAGSILQTNILDYLR